MSDIQLIEDLMNDYFYMQTRDVDNSGYTSPSSYNREYERIDKERYAAFSALKSIKQKLGVE